MNLLFGDQKESTELLNPSTNRSLSPYLSSVSFYF